MTWIKESRKDSSPVGEIKKLRAGGAATFGSNFLISYINKKLMPDNEIDNDGDGNDDDDLIIKMNEKLGRISIGAALIFLTIGTMTSILPSLHTIIPENCTKWCNGIKSYLHKFLVNSYVFVDIFFFLF